MREGQGQEEEGQGRSGAAPVEGRPVPAEAGVPAIVRAREDRVRELRWVQIGSVAGPEIARPSAALRAANLKLSFAVDAEPVPLAEVESAWNARLATGRRLVFVP